MRNFILFICLAALQVNAQTYKNKWLFENTMGNVTSNQAEWKEKYHGATYTFDDKTFHINVDLTTAYFIKKNIAIGTSINSYYTQYSSDGYTEHEVKIAEARYKSYTFLAVPFIRLYANPTSKGSLYLQGGAGGGGNLMRINESTTYYESGAVYSKYANSFLDHRIVTTQIAVGMNYFFNEYVAFNSAVGFNYTTVEYSDLVTSDYPAVTNSAARRFEFTSSQKIISWRIGFTFFVGKKKETPASKEKPN